MTGGCAVGSVSGGMMNPAVAVAWLIDVGLGKKGGGFGVNIALRKEFRRLKSYDKLQGMKKTRFF